MPFKVKSDVSYCNFYDIFFKSVKITEILQEDLLCPINHAQIIDPVIRSDGHTYERSAIKKWLKNSNNSPVTNLPLPST